MNSLTPQADDEGNVLFPVFLKLHQLQLLVIGGGAVGLEKLQAVLGNSPRAHVRLVAREVSPEVRALVGHYPNVTVEETAFAERHLKGIDVVICAIDDKLESERIHKVTQAAGILSNFADKPALCDFYLGSVVKKGHVKIGISTNGKSPTLAKRLREILTEALPDDLHQVIDNLAAIRATVQGNISEKVRVLNEATSDYRARKVDKNGNWFLKMQGRIKAKGRVVE